MTLSSDYLDGEFELFIQLSDQHVVAEALAHLHDADDGGVHLVLTVLEDALRCDRVLLGLQRDMMTHDDAR